MTLVFCAFMLWRDSRREPRMSAALWLPVLWIFIVTSQFLSQWLAILGMPGLGGASVEDGSPVDAVFFFLLMLAGVSVLVRRDISLTAVAANNAWVTVFLVYCLVAITWSDFPLVAMKRWVKILGHPIMALVILSDWNRLEAFRTVLRRCAYLHIPLSILFIKYLPQGRSFDPWSGVAAYRGINLNKNELGYACLVFGLFLFWDLFFATQNAPTTQRKKLEARWSERTIRLALLTMCGWLLLTSDSATALTCTVLGASAMVLAGSTLVSRKHLGSYVVVAISVLVMAELSFGLYAAAVEFLGRDPTLTDRTILWADLLSMDINSIIGAGFESFWLGPRLELVWSTRWWRPNQAHNGYIETYLNLGYVGLALLLGMIVATFRKSQNELLRHLDFGRWRLGALAAIVVYNYTEATFKSLHPLWMMFYLASLDYPRNKVVQDTISSSGRQPQVDAARPLAWRRTSRSRGSNAGSGVVSRPAVQRRFRVR